MATIIKLVEFDPWSGTMRVYIERTQEAKEITKTSM
jgi:hypothetical protein